MVLIKDIVFYPLLTEGIFAIIDKADWKTVNRGSWYAIPAGKKLRVRGRVNTYKQIYLSHYLLGVSSDREIDNRNRNPLDCRRDNLHIVTHRVNLLNKDLDPRNVSGYRGVSKHSTSNKWAANAWLNYKQYYLGLFECPIEASKVVEEFYDTY
jgi:hypothetical protein